MQEESKKFNFAKITYFTENYTMFRSTFLFSFLFIFLFSCNEVKPEKHFLERNISMSKKMEFLLKPHELKHSGIEASELDFLKEFYKKRNYKPVWISKNEYSEKGKEMLALFNFPEQIGIPKKRYESLQLNDTLLRNECVLTLFFARSLADLNRGFLDSTLAEFKSFSTLSITEFESNFADFENGISTEKLYFDQIPADTNYQKIWLALNHFSTSTHIDREDFDIPLQKKDSLTAWDLAKKALRNKKILVSDSTHAEIAALKNFQQFSNQKVDGVIGESTAQLLGESSYSKLLRTCLTLEKMRHRTSRNKIFVWINIPEFKLIYVHDDTLRSVNRVVVGTAKNQTPALKSSIHSIVALPYWNVPYSIASKEILPALQRNPNYLARNKMILFQKKVEVDPSTINWKKYKETSFPFQVRQEPGPHNSLGIIKFEFHNKYSVYVHDSPAKSLFGTINRSYSHGCIRCENPVELGKMMLTFDENSMTADSLDSLYSRNLHTSIPLKKRIPIFIEYYTVTVNEQGNLLFLRDLYRKEEKIVAGWRASKK